ncbi:hypothetical protein CROQUDRAFT_396509 [Cronartium quercuum f. sp. fusiforme G11]|uniref:Uncharacterized protein n=1 Tax=Cronartium quercuum f. sp. fusiforme G11 TaxID=708437 RepID=A0A9P6TDK8_9BASI|nr:hypothetical protein CROQUDRAFT_396509 [Cronartium quercuum f. sp. fusiforme G11]
MIIIINFSPLAVLTASDEALQQDIRYTNEEIDDLIQRTSEESKSNETSDSAKKVDKTFAFARVWEGRSRGLTSMDKVAADEETTNVQEQRSFWDSILQANQEEEQAAAASKETETGRGYRKRREVAYTLPEVEVSPKKRRTGGLNGEEDDLENDEDFKLPDQALESSDSEHVDLVDDDDVVIMPPGYAPNPSDAAKKAAAAEKKVKKRSSIFKDPAQVFSMCHWASLSRKQITITLYQCQDLQKSLGS